ncbi:MAG: hypothetical protein DI538_14880, partial [Azospira oryzae]
MKFYVLAFCLLTGRCAFAQVDSLEQQLPTLQGVKKAMAYQNIVGYYIRSDLKKATAFLAEAKQFAKTQNDPSSRAYLSL